MRPAAPSSEHADLSLDGTEGRQNNIAILGGETPISNQRPPSVANKAKRGKLSQAPSCFSENN